MAQKVLIEVEDSKGENRFVWAEVKSKRDDHLAVESKRHAGSWLLRAEDRRWHVSFLGFRKPFWRVKDGFPASSRLLQTRVTPADSKGRNGGPALAEPEEAVLDSHYFFRLLDDKAVGDYIASQVFVPYVQAAILIAAGAACVAAVLAWFAYGSAQHAEETAARVLDLIRQQSGA